MTSALRHKQTVFLPLDLHRFMYTITRSGHTSCSPCGIQGWKGEWSGHNVFNAIALSRRFEQLRTKSHSKFAASTLQFN